MQSLLRTAYSYDIDQDRAFARHDTSEAHKNSPRIAMPALARRLQEPREPREPRARLQQPIRGAYLPEGQAKTACRSSQGLVWSGLGAHKVGMKVTNIIQRDCMLPTWQKLSNDSARALR